MRLLSVASGVVGVATLAGLTWTVQTTNVTASLRGVSAVSDRVVWASGSGGTVLRTSDGGATWTRLAVPDAGNVDFRDIAAIDARVAYVLSIGNGDTSRIYKTTDAGGTWTLEFKNADPQVFLDAMAFWDERHGIAVSDSADHHFALFRTDDGRTWARIPPASLPPALDNEGAFAASGTNLAVVGPNDVWYGTGAAAQGRVLHSRDRGRTWTVAVTPLATGAAAGIFSIAFRNLRHGIVVGGDYQQTRATSDNCAVTSDGGATWTLVQGLSGYRSAVAYVPHASTPSLIAVGPSGADFSSDDGETWTPMIGAPNLNAFSFSPTGAMGWGAGGRGRIVLLDGLRERQSSGG